MTRYCCVCKKVFGEKCANPGCRCQNLIAVDGWHWWCPDCKQISHTGDGGRTHGFCPVCERTVRLQAGLPERHTAEVAYA